LPAPRLRLRDATANDAACFLSFSTIVDFALFQTPVEPFLTKK
jgi:hypothetical protein